MNWTDHQSSALKEVEKWFKSKPRKPIFRVFGYAGVGKTSLAKHFASSVKGTVLYAAFTGKAASMMRRNGCHNATTIHSLIYTAVRDSYGRVKFHLNPSSILSVASLLIIDECSMVDEKLARDILSFKVPILVLGDPAQLPPVAGSGYFINETPDVMLTEIHRQARDNPIIHLATTVRENGKLQVGQYGESIVAPKIKSIEHFLTYDQVIVGRNTTRTKFNSVIRNMLNITDTYPVVNDKLICIKNDHGRGILNGEMFIVNEVCGPKGNPKFDNYYRDYQIKDIDRNTSDFLVTIHNSFFNGKPKPDWKLLANTQEFDFGYAITAHKSQGSQWDNVLILDESWISKEHPNRWLYTAITRAQNKILLYKTE